MRRPSPPQSKPKPKPPPSDTAAAVAAAELECHNYANDLEAIREELHGELSKQYASLHKKCREELLEEAVWFEDAILDALVEQVVKQVVCKQRLFNELLARNIDLPHEADAVPTAAAVDTATAANVAAMEAAAAAIEAAAAALPPPLLQPPQ